MIHLRPTLFVLLALPLASCMTVQPPQYESGFFYQLPAGKWWKPNTDYMGGVHHEFVRFAGPYTYRINIYGWGTPERCQVNCAADN